MACTATEECQKLEISGLERKVIILKKVLFRCPVTVYLFSYTQAGVFFHGEAKLSCDIDDIEQIIP